MIQRVYDGEEEVDFRALRAQFLLYEGVNEIIASPAAVHRIATKERDDRYRNGTKERFMVTERCVIDDGILARARGMKGAGDVPDHIFADQEARGLRLRVRGRNASWELKSGDRTLCIGQLDRMLAKEARSRARIGRDLLMGGIDPNPFFAARLAGLSEAEARRIAHETHGTLPKPGLEAGPVWTVGELMDRYVQDNVAQPKRVKNGPPKSPSHHTVKEVGRLFGKPAFDRIRDTPLAKLDAAALQNVRRAITESSTVGQSAKSLGYVKSALSWASRLETRPAGLADPWWTRVSAEQPAPVRPQNTLFVEEIGRLLAIAELNRVLPGRSIARETSEMTLCMLWWLIVTAQRSSASSLVLRRHVVQHRQNRWAGWGIVSYPAENMKSRRFHSLPLPPLAMAVVARARDAARTIGRDDSQWLFPSVRTASRTRASCDLGANERCVGQLLRRLRGDDVKGLEVDAPNLLSELPYFTPHNIRHSFATRFGDTAAAGGSVSAVFDHAVVTPDGREFRRSGMLDVYDKSHRLPLKAQVLSPWCFSILLHYERALADMMSPGSPHEAAKPWRFATDPEILLKPWEEDDDGFSKVR